MTFAIATTEDVARYLGSTVPTDLDILEPYLNAAIESVKLITNLEFKPPGTHVKQEEFVVREQSYLKIRDLSPTEVRITVTMIDDQAALLNRPWLLNEGNDFVLETDSKGYKRFIRITSSLFFRLVGYDFAYGKRNAMTWDKVEIDYVASGHVPQFVTEATAEIAAAAYAQRSLHISGVTSEHIGDYSYTLKNPASMTIPEHARFQLRQLRGTRSRST